MDINVLPEELLEDIFSYLGLQDVLACCLVCRHWRNVANTNRLWFKFCTERSPVHKSQCELIPAPLLVDPVFIPPNEWCDTLSKVCFWRLRFMQEAHLSRNWRFGRFVSYPITRTLNPLCTECDEDVLIVLSIERREFSSFDIKSVPILKQTTQFSLKHIFADFFKLYGGKLVVAQCTLLQVYTKNKSNDNIFELTHRFLFNKPESGSSFIPNPADISEWYNATVGLYPSDINIDCDHNGDYFVGLVQEGNLSNAVFHIWDINNGNKISEQPVPENVDLVISIHFSIHSSNLHILLKHTDGMKEYTTIRCFCLQSFNYADTCLTFDYVVPIVLFHNKYILNIDESGKSLWIWKTKGGSLTQKVSCDFVIHPSTLQLAHSMIIFAGNSLSECSGTVQVFCTESLKVISRFVADYRVNNLLFIRAGLILVCGWMQLGLWDMTTSTKVHTFDYHDCLWISPQNTKTLVENDDELILLHFW